MCVYLCMYARANKRRLILSRKAKTPTCRDEGILVPSKLINPEASLRNSGFVPLPPASHYLVISCTFFITSICWPKL